MTETACPQCGAGMARGVRPMTIAYKDHEAEIDMPGLYCGECDESLHDGADMKVSDKALNRLKAEAEGVLASDEIQRIRKKLKLSQKSAGLLIGGGPRAFQKYESGEILASRAISSALRLLDRDPKRLKELGSI